MGKSGSRVPKSKNIMGTKKVSRGILRSKLLWAAIAVALLVGGFFAYKYIHYVSAPEAIKLIRQEKIYNYESENLKIVRRTEDYGGTDWKGVYGEPKVTIRYRISNTFDSDIITEIDKLLLSVGWQSMPRSNGDMKENIYRYEKEYSNSKVSANFSMTDNSAVAVIREHGNGIDK